MKMKGKNKFTRSEIEQIRDLIKQRINAGRSEQKGIRAKMRRLGFYGQDDFGIMDMQPEDLDRLIQSGRIIVLGESVAPAIKKLPITPKAIPVKPSSSSSTAAGLDFQKFDPRTGLAMDIPDSPGNYIVCLRHGSKLPEVPVKYTIREFKGLDVIYTGIASQSLRKRDYRQHFTGNNAGASTLRKSLGSMFGFKKIPRDRNKPENGKTKFNESDEARLSQWMADSLVLFFAISPDPEGNETKLINAYNPPLNLSKNSNPINKEYREYLSALRSQK
jgi:hypothetical protein